MTVEELDALTEGATVWLRAKVVYVNGDSIDLELDDGDIVPWDFESVYLAPRMEGETNGDPA